MTFNESLDRPLTELQLRIMEILWARDEASASEVRRFLQPDHALARTTVATLLSRLEEKGLITHRSQGREYFYRTLFSRQEVVRAQVREFAGRVFQRDYSALVCSLLGDAEVSAEELAEIKRLIEAAEESRD